MVPGRLKPGVVVDLDGTLLLSNSLRIYTHHAITLALRKGHIAKAIAASAWVAVRKLKLCSHFTMKRHLLLLTAGLYSNSSNMNSLATKIKELINPQVIALLEKYHADGQPVVLATAAPALYADLLIALPYIDSVVATPTPEPRESWAECRATKKVEAAATALAELSAEIAVVITDHADDLPLLRTNNHGLNILVNPSKATLSTVNKSGISYRLL